MKTLKRIINKQLWVTFINILILVVLMIISHKNDEGFKSDIIGIVYCLLNIIVVISMIWLVYNSTKWDIILKHPNRHKREIKLLLSLYEFTFNKKQGSKGFCHKLIVWREHYSLDYSDYDLILDLIKDNFPKTRYENTLFHWKPKDWRIRRKWLYNLIKQQLDSYYNDEILNNLKIMYEYSSKDKRKEMLGNALMHKINGICILYYNIPRNILVEEEVNFLVYLQKRFPRRRYLFGLYHWIPNFWWPRRRFLKKLINKRRKELNNDISLKLDTLSGIDI